MGLRNWLHNKHMSDPVDGTLELTSCSAAPSGAASASCRMQGVVSAPGLAPTPVEHRCLAPVNKWPQPGDTIPVSVDRADPSRLEVRWDAMPTGREVGRQLAEQLAAQMQAGQPQAAAAAQAQAGQFGVVGDPSRPLPGMPGGGLTPEQTAAVVSGGAVHGWLQAAARVLAVHEVPVPPGTPGAAPAGTVDLTLDVALPAGDGYSTTMRIGFSTAEKRARVAAVGATLPVLVNAAAPDQIAIDTNRLV